MACKKDERQNPKEIRKHQGVTGIELKHQIKGGAMGSFLFGNFLQIFTKNQNALGTHPHTAQAHITQEEKCSLGCSKHHLGTFFPLVLET